MENKKDSIVDIFKSTPKRRITEIEKQIIFILIEKSKIQRERSLSILNKGFMIFAIFIIIGYLSRLYNVLSQFYINIIFIVGLVTLIFSIITYYKVISKEEKILDSILDNFLM